MSVKLKVLPQLIDFRILPVALPISGFFVSAAMAIPVNGLAMFNAGLRNLLQASRGL